MAQIVLGEELTPYQIRAWKLAFLDERGPVKLYGFPGKHSVCYAVARHNKLICVTSEHSIARCALEQEKGQARG